MKSFIPFCVLCVLCGSSAFAEDHFVTSYWCGPPAKFTTSERYKEIKEANFTVAMGTCSGLNVEQNLQMLDFCRDNGLKAIVSDSRMVLSIGGNAANKASLDGIIKDYAAHPALFGYYVVDEPGAGAFPGLGEVVGYLREKDPAHIGYINLLPTYGRDFNALGTKTYEEYVRRYAEVVKPSVISYDHYHFTNHGDRADFFENLETVRKVSVEKKIPFWNIVLCVQHFDYRNLTEAELRFEAMQTLAFGGHGVLWFTYWAPPDDKTVVWKHAMINPDGSRDPHYEMIKRVNAETLALGDELVACESVDVKSPKLGKDGVPSGITVGTFKDPDGRTVVLLANADYKNAATASAPGDARNLEVFDPAAKKWSVSADRSFPLAPAEANLLRWSAK